LIADDIVAFIERQGSRYVFGVPGSTTISLINSISNSKKLKFIAALHENASIAMADGYSRASGEFATVVLHTTPGLSTALPNLYNSFVDSVPLLVLVGDVNSKSLIRQPGLGLDRLEDIARPLTRWCYYTKSATDVITAIQRCGAILSSPQPGPCCVIIPEDILELESQKKLNYDLFSPHGKITITPERKQIVHLVSLMDDAEWPVLIVGREIRSEESIRSLLQFCEALSIPVLLESPYPSAYNMSFPQDSICYLGLFRRESEVMKGADLLVGLGGQLFTERKYYDDYPFDSDKTKVAHIHANPWELGKNVRTDIRILGTPDKVAVMLNEASKELDTRTKAKHNRKSRKARIELIHSKRVHEREKLLSRLQKGSRIKPWKLVSILYDVLSKEQSRGHDFTLVDEGVVTSSYLSELFVFTKPLSLMGRSAGCLGWGVNAAIGAKLALPERKVVAFVGDGALIFCPQGLWTAAHYKIPVTVIVCNNSGYSSVELAYDSFRKRSHAKKVVRNGTAIVEPSLDIVKLAEALGVEGISITKEDHLLRVLKNNTSSDELKLIDVHTDPNEKGFELSVGRNSAWT
jgi:benzoylformate decarboxylase